MNKFVIMKHAPAKARAESIPRAMPIGTANASDSLEIDRRDVPSRAAGLRSIGQVGASARA